MPFWKLLVLPSKAIEQPVRLQQLPHTETLPRTLAGFNLSFPLFPTQHKHAHLLLCDLHVKQDVIDQVWQSLLHGALKFVVFQQGMNKLKYAEHQIFKAQNFTWTKWKKQKENMSEYANIQKGTNGCEKNYKLLACLSRLFIHSTGLAKCSSSLRRISDLITFCSIPTTYPSLKFTSSTSNLFDFLSSHYF